MCRFDAIVHPNRRLRFVEVRYSLFQRKSLFDVSELVDNEPWDVFLSAFNAEERINRVFAAVPASKKQFFQLPDYRVNDETISETILSPQGDTESEIVAEIVSSGGVEQGARVCIDATGVVRQYLPALMKCLMLQGVNRFHLMYSEPARYGNKEETRFSSTEYIEVRQVFGFEGSHNTDTSRDVLIIGAGYEQSLITAVSESKSHADKRVIYGFPSMRADMYQESVLSSYISRESLGEKAVMSPRFAPAYDPFVTAETLQSIVSEIESSKGTISNLYLAPVSSKPMTIGFALYYLLERQQTSTSIILPFAESYSNRSAFGIGRIWIYHVELDFFAQ